MDRRPEPYESGQDIRDRTFVFACAVVKFCKQLYAAGGVARIMVPQLVNCSTSLAGMLEEARAGESDRDFISKCSIGLKECREARVRLRVCVATRLGPSDEARGLVNEAGQLVAIIGAIIRNKRRNAGLEVKSPRSKTMIGSKKANS